MIASSSSALALASIFVLTCVTLLTTVPVVDAGMMTNMLNKAYSFLGYETCEHPNVHNYGARRLKMALKGELFGQHLALEIISKAVQAHISDPNPPKALVLSLHGWAGAGKTFTSQHLMTSLYAKGLNSSFIRFFMSSYHFPDPNRVDKYKELVKKNIEEVVKKCPRALFVFDEVDKTPVGVLDVLVPYIHHPGQILDGYDYKKAIFVFLSNVGANNITRISHMAWKEGKQREELSFKDFEHVLSNEVFNDNSGGLYKSRIIDKVLVDYFVPFLPLERGHIISCIKVQAKRQAMNQSIIDEEAERIADMLTYWPADLKLYSTTGCKKVDTFVKFRMTELQNLQGGDPDNEGDDYYSDYDEGTDAKTEL